jgi:hypothetical protein
LFFPLIFQYQNNTNINKCIIKVASSSIVHLKASFLAGTKGRSEQTGIVEGLKNEQAGIHAGA